MTNKTCFLLILTLVVLTSCTSLSSRHAPGLLFDQIVIENQSGRRLDNVEIKVANINKKFSCGVVLPGLYCANGFSPREYQHNAVTITWDSAGRSYSDGPILLDIRQVSMSYVYNVIIAIDNSAQIKTYLSPSDSTLGF